MKIKVLEEQNILLYLNKWKCWQLIPDMYAKGQNLGIDCSISQNQRLNNLYHDSVHLHIMLVSRANISTCSSILLDYTLQNSSWISMVFFFLFFFNPFSMSMSSFSFFSCCTTLQSPLEKTITIYLFIIGMQQECNENLKLKILGHKIRLYPYGC